MRIWRGATATTAVALLMLGRVVSAQTDGPEPAASRDVSRAPALTTTSTATPWMLMYDGILFLNLNHQGGPRGGTEVVGPNWVMGMATRDTGAGRLTFDGMLSLDPASVGEQGYRELFQGGEAFNGHPIVDRQHPHDMFMQLAAVWRMPVSSSTGLTIAGGPAGEPALGPVAFMHRLSAADNPTAPLTHHTFDSTHIAYGVVTAAVDHGPLVVEASLFNGREPDQNRWDFDFGRLDSYSARVWFHPNADWELQVSSGHLTDPEQLEPGDNVIRSTASASWTRRRGGALSAVTVGIGRNDTVHGPRHGVLAEAARQTDRHTFYGRFETVQVETAVLASGTVPEGAAADATDTVGALTLGAVRNVAHWWGFTGGVGADVTMYAVPTVLRPMYSDHPVSFHLFFRIRPPAGMMGRMWNMRMSQPLAGHGM